MLSKHEANSQENNNTEKQSQQSHFATLLKSQPRTDISKKNYRTSAKHPPPGEYLFRTLIIKGFYLVIKRNLLTLKINK